MMAVSQNGWPVSPARSSRTIPGSAVRVTVVDGVAGDVLMYVLSQIDKRVEDIDLKSTRGELDDWGFANRDVRGGTDKSNHASATAVDVNATRHPLGVAGTFSTAQVREIHKILAEVDNVVRWGGDYTGRKDEMHFEINAPHERVARVAARLAGNEEKELSALTDSIEDLGYRVKALEDLDTQTRGGPKKGERVRFTERFVALEKAIEDLGYRVQALTGDLPNTTGGPSKGEQNKLGDRLDTLEKKLDDVLAALSGKLQSQ